MPQVLLSGTFETVILDGLARYPANEADCVTSLLHGRLAVQARYVLKASRREHHDHCMQQHFRAERPAVSEHIVIT